MSAVMRVVFIGDSLTDCGRQYEHAPHADGTRPDWLRRQSCGLTD
jgi:hypothetical protein